MPLRPLILLSLVALLAACSSDKPKPVAPVAPAPKPAAIGAEPLGPLPAFQRELTGTVLGAPANAEVELALLAVDERSRPQKLLASTKLIGTGKALPFQLRFNPEAFPQGLRVELRGRASQSGQLILHLPAVPVSQPTTQALGQLQLLQAP
ncbi:YbaY family lipoprotein [Pseudomonas sp. TE3610]